MTKVKSRWAMLEHHADCPDDCPWAVVNAETNEALAFFTDEVTATQLVDWLDTEEDHSDELIAATIESLGGKPKPGTKPDKRLRKNKNQADTTELAAAVDQTDAPQWRGVLVVEGTPTGDGREFANDSLSWPDPVEVTLTLQWQKVSSHGGMPTDETVAVGRIDRIWREPGAAANTYNVMGEGRFDIHPDAVEAQRRMEAGMLNGTSINADDISDADIEYVFPEGEEGEEDDLFMLLFAQPEKVIFHSARLRATTLCDIPAFVEAVLHTIDESEALTAGAGLVETSHHTDTSDAAWDGGEHEARLPGSMAESIALEAYAHVDAPGEPGDEVDKTAGRFLHHEIDEHGVPSAANLTACSTGIGVLHGSRGGSTLSGTARRQAYNHLAQHLRDAGQEPPPFQLPGSLVAHAFVDQWRPSAAWFTNPNLGQVTPIMITDQGRVYGYAAQWNECHLGYMNECVMAPRDDDFGRYLTGELPLDDGTRIACGVLVAGIPHAPLSYRANQASDHYDNTDAQVAYITVGNDKRGIWVAGAILPWAQEARVSALRASGQVSPDWRRIGGKLRMVGMLAVNTSGYQTEKPRARALVASGEVQALIASGMVALQHHGPSQSELNDMALKLLREKLAARVHPTTKEA